MKKLLAVAIATGVLVAGSYAAPFRNVTIWDGTNGQNEDQEMDVAPFVQEREVEAFLWNGEDLSLIGGYDFEDGYYYYNKHITTGDIFIDLGNNNSYDLALKFDFENLTYDIIGVEDVVPVTYPGHSFANPLSAIGPVLQSGLALDYSKGLTDEQVGFGLEGGNHNQVTLYGLNNYGVTNSFGLHYTMSCGNDMIKGNVPEPALISFLGISLLGLVFVRRRKNR